jgi:hypothetical protein
MNTVTLALRQSGRNLKLTIHFKLAGWSTIRKSHYLSYILCTAGACVMPLFRIYVCWLFVLRFYPICLFRLWWRHLLHGRKYFRGIVKGGHCDQSVWKVAGRIKLLTVHFILQRVQHAQPSVKFKDLCSRISAFVLSAQKPASVMFLHTFLGQKERLLCYGELPLKQTPYLENYYPEYKHIT